MIWCMKTEILSWNKKLANLVKKNAEEGTDRTGGPWITGFSSQRLAEPCLQLGVTKQDFCCDFSSICGPRTVHATQYGQPI